MNFASLAFFCFLPTVWLLYWLLSKRSWQNVLLVTASYFFYGWWDYRFCVLMLASSLVDFWVSLQLERHEQQRSRKMLLFVSLICNLGLLGFFKYCNFFIESFLEATQALGWNLDTGTLDIILPVGISFYTFQTLSYTIDVYRRKLTPTHNIIDYLTFVSFFPQLVAGPIERASRLLPQFQCQRKFDWEDIQDGSRQILWGFFKKIVIADTLAPFVKEFYTTPGASSGTELALATFFFAFQIYCDFSGYSDIAIGTARLFGIRLMKNFATPYFASNLREFWQRWHISLSTWFRDYVYIPLGGNQVGKWRQKWNLLITFLVSGLWHGAAWRFVIWGGIHGMSVMLTRSSFGGGTAKSNELHISKQMETEQLQRWFSRLLHPAKVLITFLIVCLGWIFFRADTLSDAIEIMGRISAGVSTSEFYHQFASITQVRTEIRRALWLIFALVVVEFIQRKKDHPLMVNGLAEPFRWSCYSLATWFVIEYSTTTHQDPFIYFQF